MCMYYARAAWGNNIVPDMQYTYHITIATQQMNTLNTCTSQMEILVFLEVSKKLSTKPLESSMALTLTGFSHKHVLSDPAPLSKRILHRIQNVNKSSVSVHVFNFKHYSLR